MAVTKVLSKQDGDLNTSTLITSRKKVYRDIDISFTAKPNGELYIKKDAAAVSQAIKNLLLTNHFEKPFQPFFGGNITSKLFELIDDPDMEEELRDEISYQIELYEPRALVRKLDVKAEEDYNSLSVTLEYQVINTQELVTLTTSVSRLR
jgi:phage baseplate assembly protein W